MRDDLSEQFGQRVEAIHKYEATWWLQKVEPQRSFLQQRPQLHRQLALAYKATGGKKSVTTREVYGDTSGPAKALGGWTSRRTTLHRSLLDELIARVHGSRQWPCRLERLAEAPLSAPAYLLLGLPGSGKTSCLRPLVVQHAKAVAIKHVVDADSIRVEFPEYADGLGSQVVQDETATLTYADSKYPPCGGMRGRLSACAEILVYDIIGSPDYLPATVRSLNEAGRDVYILMSECSVDICLARAMRRALEPGGRYVPLAFIRQRVGVSRDALRAALDTGLVAGWAVYNTEETPAAFMDGDAIFASLSQPTQGGEGKDPVPSAPVRH